MIGFNFDPIEIQRHPERKGKYRILDGVHRWNAYKVCGLGSDHAKYLIFCIKSSKNGCFLVLNIPF